MTTEPVVVAPRPAGSTFSPTATVVGLLALVFSSLYFLSDVIEVIQAASP